MRFGFRFIGLLVSLAQAAWAQPRGTPQHHLVDFEQTSPHPGVSRLHLTVQEGENPFNRFDVIRLRKAAEGNPPGKNQCDRTPALILLSPFGFPAEFWEQSDDGTYLDAFAPKLAEAGHDVWLVDSRLAQAAAGECESGIVDCSPMQSWGVETAVRDALFVARLAKSRGGAPVIGGFSGGSAVALAAVNDKPQKFSGLFLWEGTLLSDDPVVRARNATFCQNDISALDAGLFYDSSVQGFQTLFFLAQTQPDATSPIPVFPPGTTNLQALLFALTLPDTQNPLNFTDSFIRLAGDPISTTLTYSDLSRVLGLGSLVGNYAPISFIRDSHCSIAGEDNRFTFNLEKFHGKVLVYAAGRGFNAMMLDTAARLTHADVTIDYQPDFGESDRFFHLGWEDVALAPLISFLGG